MATEDTVPRATRRKFLAWSAAAAASAGLAPLLSACGGAAPAPTAKPAAPAGQSTAAPAAPAAAPTKAAAAASPAAKAAVIELKLDQHEPAQANLGKTYQQYADTVNKAAEGRLHITVYPAETLSKAADAYSNCVNGVNDIAWTGPSYVPGQFRLTEAFHLPLIGITSGKHGARAMSQWFKTNSYLQKEWGQVHVLAAACNGIMQLYTAKKPVRKLEDAAGMRLRCSGFGITNYVKGIGANPIPTSVPEVPEALSKGILDGAMLDWQAVLSHQLQDQLKYNNPLGLYNSSVMIVFNKKKWESIPPDLQKILENPPGLMWQTWDTALKGPASSLPEFISNGFDVADPIGIEAFKKVGGEQITYTPEETAKWQKAAEPVWDAWAETVKDQPFDAKKELATLREIIAKTK